MTHEIPNCAEFFADRARQKKQRIDSQVDSLRLQFCDRLKKTKTDSRGALVIDLTYAQEVEPEALVQVKSEFKDRGWEVVDLGWKTDRRGDDGFDKTSGILQVTGSPPVGDYDASLRRLLRADS